MWYDTAARGNVTQNQAHTRDSKNREIARMATPTRLQSSLIKLASPGSLSFLYALPDDAPAKMDTIPKMWIHPKESNRITGPFEIIAKKKKKQTLGGTETSFCIWQ